MVPSFFSLCGVIPFSGCNTASKEASSTLSLRFIALAFSALQASLLNLFLARVFSHAVTCRATIPVCVALAISVLSCLILVHRKAVQLSVLQTALLKSLHCDVSKNTAPIPQNKTVLQYGVQWWDQAPQYHFCVLPLTIHLCVWTCLLSPFVPS